MLELDADAVVAGSGAGGLVAALVLAERGMNVMLFERGDKLGGGAALSNGEVWVPGNHLELRSGISDSIPQGEAYLDEISSGSYVDRRLRKVWLSSAPSAVRFLEEKGVRWRTIENLSDTYYPGAENSLSKGRLLEVEPFVKGSLGRWGADTILLSPHVPYQLTNDEMISKGGAGRVHILKELVERRNREGILCQGPGLVAYLVKAAANAGVKIFTEHRVVSVERKKESSEVAVSWRGGTKKVHANSVLLNIGGYDWHSTYARIYEQVPEYHSPMPPWVSGDSILISAQVGAAFVAYRIMNPRLGYHIPGEYFLGRPLYRQVTYETGYPHAIVVNKDGKRFADESQFHILAREAASYVYGKGYVNFPCFVVFDEEFRRSYSFGPITPQWKMPVGFAVNADTLRQLEVSLGIPAKSLVSTVEEFNQEAQKGRDPRFERGLNKWANQFAGDVKHKPNPNLGEVRTPPFYAIRLTFVGIGRNAGYLIDHNANVLDARLKPIRGLYACGNCVASTEIGRTYQDGSALSRSIAFGYLSALNILKV